MRAGLVLRLLGDRLIERRLIGPRIDLHENVALLDHLALLEGDLDDLAIDAAADENGLVRLHGAEPVQIDREVGLFRLCDGDGDGRGRLYAIDCARTRRPGIAAVKVAPAEVGAERDRDYDGYQRPAASEKR